MNLFRLFSQTELTTSPLACLPEKVNQILQQLQQCFLLNLNIIIEAFPVSNENFIYLSIYCYIDGAL